MNQLRTTRCSDAAKIFRAMTEPIKTAALERNHQGTRLREFHARGISDSRRNFYRQWIAYVGGERIHVRRALRYAGRYLIRYKIKASGTHCRSREEVMGRLVVGGFTTGGRRRSANLKRRIAG